MKRSQVRTISARIKDSIVKQLTEVAEETERTMSFHIEKALQLYLSEYADLQIALDRLNDPTDRIITFEEMEEQVGLHNHL
jgi:RHH-type rel operon transcriptional repressor/antitoxin RelB